MEWSKGFATNYELGDVLGQGAFGVVRRCKSKKEIQRDLAAKLLIKQRMNAKQLSAVEDEVSIMHDLRDCQEIVQIVGAYSERKEFFIVMELIEGGELFDRVVVNSRLTEEVACRMVRTVLHALQQCHAKGIVHRDLKPENLLLVSQDDDSSLKVADFGCAARMPEGEGGELKGICGSPFYIAPEILKNEGYGPAVDIYSLGVITYVLLSGTVPFSGATDAATFEKIKAGKWAFSNSVWKKISAEAKDFIVQCLKMTADERPDAAKALQHPWVVQDSPSQEILEESVDNLRHYNAGRKLRAAVRAAICINRIRMATSLLRRTKSPAITVLSLTQAFEGAPDSLDLAEFEKVMKRIGFGNDLPWQKLHDLFDTDGDGTVNRVELECGLSLLGGGGEDSLRFCFQLYDKDGDGNLSREEIVDVLKCIDLNGVEEEQLHHLFERMDKNQDGKICFQEFTDAVRTEPLLAQMWLLAPSTKIAHEIEGAASERAAKKARAADLAADTIPYDN